MEKIRSIKPDDNTIIELYWERDEQAIGLTADKYGDYCYTVAWNILEDQEDSEECINDTWLKTWNTIPPTRPAKLRPFLAKITRNLSLDRYRVKHAEKRGKGELPLVFEELSECIGNGSVEDHVEGRELADTINAFVKSLEERDRNIFIRRYFYTEKTGDIAGKYQLTDDIVRKSLQRSRRKLAAHLQKEGYII